jgi:hypothetical protein
MDREINQFQAVFFNRIERKADGILQAEAAVHQAAIGQQETFASSKPSPCSDSPLTATEPYADNSANKALRPVWLSMIN